MDMFENAPEQALVWHRAGKGAALATVIQTWGSAPRRIGAQLAIAGDGEMQGSVSGGCVEGAVVLRRLRRWRRARLVFWNMASAMVMLLQWA